MSHIAGAACVNRATHYSHMPLLPPTHKHPTDVKDWQFREPVRSTSRCSAKNRFVFDWSSVGLKEERHTIHLQKAVVRTFLQVIPRLLPGNKRVPVSIYAAAHITGAEPVNERVLVQSLSVGRNSSGWLELNVTDAIATLWPPRPGAAVEVSLELQVDCRTNRKVPASFVDPATLPLENQKRRERHLPLQPLFLVFLDDEAVWQRVDQDQEAEVPEEPLDGGNATAGPGKRRRRSGRSSCHLEPFWVNFTKLGMDRIIVPKMYNAGKCVGSCDHSALSHNTFLGTNHAKLMASAHAVVQYFNVRFIHDTKDPCCVPTKFSPMGILQFSDTEHSQFVYRTYPTMKANTCGCR